MYEYYSYDPRSGAGAGAGGRDGMSIGVGIGTESTTPTTTNAPRAASRSSSGPGPGSATGAGTVPGLITWASLGEGSISRVGRPNLELDLTEEALSGGPFASTVATGGNNNKNSAGALQGARALEGIITAAELSAAGFQHPHRHFAPHPHPHPHQHPSFHGDADGLQTMEQIETQATDLRYLAQAPVPLSDTASAYETPQPQGSPGSASVGDNSAPHTAGGHHHQGSYSNSDPSNPNKRKSFDDGGSSAKQTRSKRNRYISIACNECKRRKIKCNGETPCQRCGNLNLACLYAPNCCSSNFKETDDFKQVTTQLSYLQDEVSRLSQTVKTLQNDSPRMGTAQDRMILANSSASTPSLQRQEPTTRTGPLRGPTSMAYSLEVANATISNMGYRGIGESDEQQSQHTSVDVAPMMGERSGTTDPLFEFDKDEMIRLCRLHEEEVGIMYPVLDIQHVISHARSLSSLIDSLRDQRPLEALNDDKTLQLKIVMCCALVVEEHGHSEKATRLYNSMEAVLNRKMMSETSSVAALPLLALLAGYHFLSNDEVLAWRHMGHVARLCLELGIHQKMGLMSIQSEQERKNALVSFWSAYVLDRRWALGTGLPYVVQDDEIDPQLPLPDEYPYLIAMITYSKLCSKVWRLVTHFGPVLARELRHEEIEHLDEEILQWYETVPEEVKVRSWNKERHITSTPSYNLQRLQIWTYLRLNQIRTWLYTPVLHSATSIMANPTQAQRAVDLAKDTIQYLNHLNTTTNLYRRIQVFYHQFLTSAISVVFLASVHAPVRFSAVCREEFYLALELVKDLSSKSWVSKRLWRTIKSLKDVAPRFGLNPDDDPHSTAALGMIGLARGHMSSGNGDAHASFHRPSAPSNTQLFSGSHVDQNGVMIQSEMSRIFEGYVGLNGVQQTSGDDDQQPNGSEMNSPGSPNGLRGGDGTVFPQLREMF